jgi:hypothetical protein
MAEPIAVRTPPSFRPQSGPKRLRKESILTLTAAVQERDLHILYEVYDKKVLTTHQIEDLFFPSPRAARRRLLLLYRYGLLDRFRPRADIGRSPDHYVLGQAGAEVLSAHLGKETEEIYRRDRIAKIAYSPFLQHLVSVNTFYSRLVRACRKSEGIQVEWWGEDRTRRKWAGIVIPDAFGVIESPDRTLKVLLEMDRATESPYRLKNKLPAYHMAAQVHNAPDALLFCFPTPRREVSARSALEPMGMTIVTTYFDLHLGNPLGEIWLPLNSQNRLSLLRIPISSASTTTQGGVVK